MSLRKVKNEKIRRKYFDYVRDAKGWSELTTEMIQKALWYYDEFTNHADYRAFNSKTAKEFKTWLANRKNPTSKKQLSLATQYHVLRQLRGFFTWLATQEGYRSKVKFGDVQYLNLDRKSSRIATSPKLQKFPSLEQVKALCKAIQGDTELEMRDRALIAFTLLTGMRDKAIISLPLGCFDEKEMTVNQEPKHGVKTKFSKHIITTLFRFDEILLGYVLDWVKYLKTVKKFSDADPLFPRTKLEQDNESSFSFVGKQVEPACWETTGTMCKIFEARAKEADLEYFSPHKFRHTATVEAMKYCKTAEEMKAVSQNLGHENLGTTVMTYGKIDNYRVAEVIGGMNFQPDDEAGNSPTKEQLIEMIKKL